MNCLLRKLQLKTNKLKKIRFWVPVLITVVFSYGYWLTNASIGVDDPAGMFYFDWKIWLSQGRFGDELFSWFINLSELLPGWQNSISLFLYALSAFIWITYLDDTVDGKLSISSCSIFVCSYLSFPYLSDIFVIDLAAPYAALSALFASLAALCVQIYFKEKKKGILLICSLFLTLGLGCFETSFFYFISGLSLGNVLWLFFKDYEDRRQKYYIYFQNLYKQLFCYIFVILSAFVLNRLIIHLFLSRYNLSLSQYISNYITYNNSTGIWRQLSALLAGLFSSIKADGQIAGLLLTISVALLLLLGMFKSINDKNLIPSIICFFTVIANFALFIVTGNLNMPKRTLVYLGLFIGGMWIVIIEASRTFISKVFIQNVVYRFILLAALWGILNQTQALARVFYADTIRYQWDKQKANLIDYVLCKDGMDLTKPIVFVGTCSDYTALPYQVPYGSYFSFWDDRTLQEFNNYIRFFLANCGYMYITPNSEQAEQGYVLSKSMNSVFPQEDSIQEFDEVIVVKFSDKKYQEFE